jgi:hypothetical protein
VRAILTARRDDLDLVHLRETVRALEAALDQRDLSPLLSETRPISSASLLHLPVLIVDDTQTIGASSKGCWSTGRCDRLTVDSGEKALSRRSATFW